MTGNTRGQGIGAAVAWSANALAVLVRHESISRSGDCYVKLLHFN
jgi:hypothetical protein